MANPNGNVGNLRPQNTRTKEEQRLVASKAGKASAESRRKKKDLQTAARALLEMGVQPSDDTVLEKFGIPKSQRNNMMVLLFKTFTTALSGSTNPNAQLEAIKMLMKFAGEMPEQKLAADQFEYEKEKYGQEQADVYTKLDEVLGVIKDGFDGIQPEADAVLPEGE
jgi:hypothetical protein